MFYNTFFELENIQGMFERGSKFHFIPLLCTSALFIIGETLKTEVERGNNDNCFYFLKLLHNVL
jgi:hypothetical protein